MNLPAACVLVLGLWSFGCASSAARHRTSASPTVPIVVNTNPTAVETRLLKPGDCLLITLSRKELHEPVVERVVVDAAGDVTLPLAGQVRVRGLNLEQAQAVIQSGYQPPAYGAKLHVQVARCE